MIFGIPFPKLFAFAMVALVCIMLTVQGLLGRKLKNQRLVFGKYDPLDLSKHEGIFVCNVCLILLMLLAILFAAYTAGPHSVNPWLRWGNVLTGSAAFVLFFVIRAFVTGNKHPKLHGTLVRLDLVLFIGTLATGLPMLIRL